MAIDPAPVEINLREPSKRGLLHPALAVRLECSDGRCTERARHNDSNQDGHRPPAIDFRRSEPSAVAQMPPRVAQLELETQMLSGQICALSADRDRLAGRTAGGRHRGCAGIHRVRAGGKLERVRPRRLRANR